MKDLSAEDINKQSVGTWNRWRHDWIRNSGINKDVESKKISELIDIGKDKNLLQIAFGNSLAQNIGNVIDFKNDFDIMCCDKAFSYLIKHEIIPEYCLVADANIDDIWFRDCDTSKTALIANIAANTNWTQKWKGDIYFYANWDSIRTALILGRIGNCHDVIPAASNVSNAQIVFANQIMGYNWQVLVGFDYSWEKDQYYATGDYKDKKAWMNHITAVGQDGNIIQTSTNLMFSVQWMSMYLRKTKMKVIDCSNGLLQIPNKRSFEDAMNIINHEREVNIKW